VKFAHLRKTGAGLKEDARWNWEKRVTQVALLKEGKK